jgi:hypothetical protein
MLLVPTVGEARLCEVVRAWLNSETVKIGLYKSNYTPQDTDTLATYTAIEADFPGYARLETLNWSAAGSDGAGRQFTKADFAIFTRSSTGAAQNIYGYFVYQDATGDLLWAELDPAAPKVVTNAGDAIAIRPKLTDRSEP